jgi:hypothetical protein
LEVKEMEMLDMTVEYDGELNTGLLTRVTCDGKRYTVSTVRKRSGWETAAWATGFFGLLRGPLARWHTNDPRRVKGMHAAAVDVVQHSADIIQHVAAGEVFEYDGE